MDFLKKWYTYQKERFPVLMYGIYIFAIVFGVYCFSNLILRYIKLDTQLLMVTSEPFKIDWKMIIAMFFVTFLQFLMVRIVDEFKDYEEDCKYRPYRPVPRGLITLKELKVLFVICVILQLLITFLMPGKPLTFIRLIILWVFFAIMSKSFFMKKFLEKHILIEVTLDEIMMPILVLYLTSFFTYVNPTHSFYSYIGVEFIWPLLLMSYIISWIVEIARKVRCKEDEEKGVKTYTAVFGIKGAMLILFILETLLMLVHFKILGNTYIWIVLVPYIIVNITNFLFATKQSKRWAQIVSLLANVYILICYFSLGLLIL